ncbi:MAG: type II CAAX prenyl endopeptidase Rce1 family protein [Flavobacteriaceae bacterium]
MMNFGIYNQVIVEWGIFIAFILIPIIIYRNKVNWKWVGIAVGLFLIHKIILFLGIKVLPDIIPGRYNWEGKIVSIIFLLFVAYLLFPKKFDEWGLRLSQNGDAKKAGISVAIFTAIIGTFMALFYFSGTRQGIASDWLYQLTMPAIEEEFFDRGIMLLILDKAFLLKWKFTKVNWSWGAIILILMFYLSHAISVDANWNMVIVWGDIMPFIYGLLWMYIRLATGSLLLPILLHGYINTIGYLI